MKNKERIVEYTIINNGEKVIMDLPLLLHSNKKRKSDDDIQLLIEQDDLKFVRYRGLENYKIGSIKITYLSYPSEPMSSIPPFETSYIDDSDELEKPKERKTYHSSVNLETGEVVYDIIVFDDNSCKAIGLNMKTPFRPNEQLKITIKYTKMETKENKPEVVGQDQPTQEFQSEQGVSIPEISDEVPVYGGETSTTEELSVAMENIPEAFKSELVQKPIEDRSLASTNISEAKSDVSDLVTFGDGDMWKLLCKVSSQSKKMMKSTKAIEIANIGCLVQVTTVENGVPSESTSFVPNSIIVEDFDKEGKIIGRHLEATKQPIR